MKNKGKEDHDFGIRNVSPGWHKGEFVSVEDFTNPKSDKRSLIFRIKVTEGDDEGLNASIFCAWDTDRADKMIASILLSIGLEEKFNKAFPGADVTYFDSKVVTRLSQSVPALHCQFLVEEDKNGFSNVVKVVSAKADLTKLSERKGKPAPAAAKAEKEPAEATENW